MGGYSAWLWCNNPRDDFLRRSALAVALAWAELAGVETPPEVPPLLGPGFDLDLPVYGPQEPQIPLFGGRDPLLPGPPQSGIFPVWGVHVGTPQIADVTLGIVIGTRTEFLMSTAIMAAVDGLLVTVRPGWASTAMDIGYVDVVVSPSDVFHSGYLGYTVRASMLRTYGNPLQVDGNQTFFGVAGSVHMGASLLMGVYHNLDMSADERWLIGVGLGMGL